MATQTTRYGASHNSVRSQINFFRRDPDTTDAVAQIEARAFELAEILFVGGELPKANIKNFITNFKEGRLVLASSLCNGTSATKSTTQSNFAIEAAKFNPELCALPQRKRRKVLTAHSVTGFWETVPVFVAANRTPREDGTLPVGYGVF